MYYPVKIPWLIQKLNPTYCWEINTAEKNIYLSFDDGPEPTATLFVLEELKKYNAKASFFCIGKNVALYPEIYQRIIDAGHTVGNHTQHHLNGWKTRDEEYIRDVKQASQTIHSKLFRPPYGRIKRSQAKQLQNDLKIVMWTVLSGDFDE